MNSKIWVNMDTAREVWRAKMRAAREEMWPAVDLEFSKSLEHSGAAAEKARKEAIKLKKQLRDVTKMPEIEAAKTPEELMAIWPTFLGKKS